MRADKSFKSKNLFVLCSVSSGTTDMPSGKEGSSHNEIYLSTSLVTLTAFLHSSIVIMLPDRGEGFMISYFLVLT